MSDESEPKSEASSPDKKEGAPQIDEIKREIKEEIAAAIKGGGKSDEGGEKKEGAGKDDKKDGDKKGDDKEKKKFKWTPLKIIALIVVVVIVAIVAAYYIVYSMGHETTDDAYTTGFVHQVSSRISSNVTELLVNDNQYVHQGQVLLRLDPRDFEVTVARAQANYDNAKSDFDRVDALKDDVAISKQDYDQSKDNLEVARAALKDANDQLSYCTVVAPTDGFIGNRTVDTGNRVTVGGSLMAVVQDVWIVANYKETQLGKMKKNQHVQITVDAIPGQKFHGHIDSFSPGTGSTFALLPSDNATGNFTKIVQRVPVKILFDFPPDMPPAIKARLAPGLSVETAVDLDTSVRATRDQSIKAGP